MSVLLTVPLRPHIPFSRLRYSPPPVSPSIITVFTVFSELGYPRRILTRMYFHRFPQVHVAASWLLLYLASFVLVKYSKISVPISQEASIASPTQSPQSGQETVGPSDRPSIPSSASDCRNLWSHDHNRARVYLRNFIRTRPSPSLFHTSASKQETVSTLELQDAHTMLLRNTILTFVGLLLAITGIVTCVDYIRS